MKPLGVDLSLNSTGLCTGVHNTTTVGYPLKRTATEADRIQRIRTITGTITAVAIRQHVDLVAIEDLIPGIKGANYAETVGLHYTTRYALALQGIRYVLVHNSAVKRYACGKGGGVGTDKTAIAVAVLERFAIKHDTSDETDAWLLYAMTRDRYGDPFTAMPKAHRQALAQVDWPALEEPAHG